MFNPVFFVRREANPTLPALGINNTESGVRMSLLIASVATQSFAADRAEDLRSRLKSEVVSTVEMKTFTGDAEEVLLEQVWVECRSGKLFKNPRNKRGFVTLEAHLIWLDRKAVQQERQAKHFARVQKEREEMTNYGGSTTKKPPLSAQKRKNAKRAKSIATRERMKGGGPKQKGK